MTTEPPYISGIINCVSDRCSKYRKHFSRMIPATDLDELVRQYSSAKSMLQYQKTITGHIIDETIHNMREAVYPKLVKNLPDLPLEKIISYGIELEVLGRKELLEELENRLTKEVSMLSIELIYDLLRRPEVMSHPAIKEVLFSELASRALKASCTELPKVINIGYMITEYGVYDQLKKIVSSLVTRVDCPSKQIELIKNLVSWFRLHEKSADYVAEMLSEIVENAIEKLDSLKCGDHVTLVSKLIEVKREFEWWLRPYEGKVGSALKLYTSRLLDNLNKCSVTDLTRKITQIYDHVDDKTKLLNEVIDIINRDLDKESPRIVAQVILELCNLAGNKCADLAGRVDILKMVKVIRSLIANMAKNIPDQSIDQIENLLMLRALSRVLASSRVLGPEVVNELRELCRDIKTLTNILSSEVTDPKTTITCTRSYYWIHEVKNFTSQHCGYEIEIPKLNTDKFEEIVKKDLTGGVDPYTMREAIRSLTWIDRTLMETLERKFNKIRLRQGIKFEKAIKPEYEHLFE